MSLKNTIIKALQRTQGRDIEEQAERIIDYIEDLHPELMQSDIRPVVDRLVDSQYMKGLVAATAMPSQDALERRFGGAQLIITPSRAEAEPPSRLARPQVSPKPKDDTEYRSVEDLVEMLAKAPAEMRVDTVDGGVVQIFRQPIRKNVMTLGGATTGGIAALAYCAQGDGEPISVEFSTSDAVIDMERALDEIKQAAKCKYTVRNRAPIQPRAPKPQTRFDPASPPPGTPGGSADDCDGVDTRSFYSNPIRETLNIKR